MASPKWVLPMEAGARRAASEVKRRPSDDAGGGSDHLALVNAYNRWASVKASGGVGAERAFCARNFLSPAGMNMLEGMRGQLLSELLNRGLIPSLRAASVNAADAALVRFVLGAGFVPVGTASSAAAGTTGSRPGSPPSSQHATRRRAHPSARYPPASWSFVLFLEPRGALILIISAPCSFPQTQRVIEGAHPRESSLNAGAEGPDDADAECTAVIFGEDTRNEAFMYIASSTLVRPHFLPLVAMHVQHHKDPENEDMGASGREPAAVMEVDGRLRLRLGVDLLVELAVLRLRIAAAFAAKVERPSEALPPDAEAALQVAARVFAFESRPQSGGSAAVLAPSLHAQLPLGRDRGGHRSSANHSENARGRYRAAPSAGRSAYDGSHYRARDGGRHVFSRAEFISGMRMDGENVSGRGYVPPAARSARNPNAVPLPVDGGRRAEAGHLADHGAVSKATGLEVEMRGI